MFIYSNYEQVYTNHLTVVQINNSQHLDIRTQTMVKGRSINMALSRRGRDALGYVNCEDVVVRNGIPMGARMLHDLNGNTKAVPYGIRPEHVTHLNTRKQVTFAQIIFILS